MGDRIELRDVRKAVPFSGPPVSHGPSDFPGVRVLDDLRDLEVTGGLKAAKELFEKSYIDRVLRENEFNISKAAKILKVERSNLYKLMKRLGIGKQR